MIQRVEIFTKSDYLDVHGQEVLSDIRQMGVQTVEAVQAIKVFLLGGELEQDRVERTSCRSYQ